MDHKILDRKLTHDVVNMLMLSALLKTIYDFTNSKIISRHSTMEYQNIVVWSFSENMLSIKQ